MFRLALILSVCDVAIAAWLLWKLNHSPVIEETMDYHVFITIDHDRRIVRVVDDLRSTTLEWNEDSEPMQIDVAPGDVPVLLGRKKADAKHGG